MNSKIKADKFKSIKNKSESTFRAEFNPVSPFEPI